MSQCKQAPSAAHGTTRMNAIDTATLVLSTLFGLLSLLLCICVALEAGADWREQQRGQDGRIVTRVQAVFQLPLAIQSLVHLLTIFLSPFDPSVYFGTKSTCQLQGFLTQVGMQGGVAVDSFLSLVYLLMIKTNWQEQQLARLEKWIYILIGPCVIGPAVYLWRNQSFQANASVCWIVDCYNNPICEHDNAGAMLLRSASGVAALFHLLFSLYAMSRIYSAFSTSTNPTASNMARKGLCYAASVMVINIPYLLATGLRRVHQSRSLQILCATTIALGGFSTGWSS